MYNMASNMKVTESLCDLLFICFQVPAYIITLHDLLALTPHDHVERNTLEYAQSVLEELSTVSCYKGFSVKLNRLLQFLQKISSVVISSTKPKTE